MLRSALAEQRAAADLLLSGHQDQRGLRQAVEDWVMEEVLEQTGYAEFLSRKVQYGAESGFDPLVLPEFLFPFQRFLCEWAIRKGRAALFVDCGLGKTPMQLVWADNVARKTGKRVLILTPLAVGAQTIREAGKFNIGAERSRDGALPDAPATRAPDRRRRSPNIPGRNRA